MYDLDYQGPKRNPKYLNYINTVRIWTADKPTLLWRTLIGICLNHSIFKFGNVIQVSDLRYGIYRLMSWTTRLANGIKLTI